MTEELKKQLILASESFMVGILAENEQYYPYVGETQECVTELKNSNGKAAVFFVFPLCVSPEPITEQIDRLISQQLYIGIDDHQSDAIKPSGYNWIQDIEQKKTMLKNKLNGKLLLFRPKVEIKVNKHTGEDQFYKNLNIISIESDISIDKNSEFVAVPSIEMSNIDFEKRLREGQDITLKDYNHSMYAPEYIVCGEFLYFNFPEWSKHRLNTRIWSCEKLGEKVLKVKLNLDGGEFRDKLIMATPNLLFVDKMLLHSLEKGSEIISIAEYKEAVNLKDGESQENMYSNDEEKDTSEYDFIEGLRQHAMDKGLCYSHEDLVNLHICIKTNPLTIVSGMSGTGKSELASLYSTMLGASESAGTLLFLPISPAFTEPADILGFLNNTTGLFTPSETGLTDILIHAQENLKTTHFIIFDEMNLSQVEYWFAPFISLLERRVEDRRLSLYGSAHCINKKQYPDIIPIGDNIKFIGTVNMDETTKDFSDRLLDRANVISLQKESFAQLKSSLGNNIQREQDYKNIIKAFKEKSVNWKIALPWTEAFSNEEINFLDELHNLLIQYDAQKGVSFRIAKKIGEYLVNIPKDTQGNLMIERRKAIDIQIKQRVATKIKGTERQYGGLVGVIKESGSDQIEDSKLVDFLNSPLAQSISDFELTKKEIIRKAKDMSAYGYAN